MHVLETLVGRFREAPNPVTAFDATFEQHCESLTAPALRGEIRYNANVALAVNDPTRYRHRIWVRP